MSKESQVYNHYRNFITHEQCDDILHHILHEFRVPNHKKDGLYAQQSTNRLLIPDDSNFIISKINELYSNYIDFDKYEISLINSQEYTNGRGLKSHIDSASHLTSVCLLTDGFIGGDFFVEDNVINLKKGDLLVFNGGKYYHGLESVTKGYRVTLNVWFKYLQKPLF